MANVNYSHKGSKSNRSSPRKEISSHSPRRDSSKFKSEANLYVRKKKQISPRKSKIELQKRKKSQDDNQPFYPKEVIDNESDSESEFFSILGGAI